MDNSLLLDDLKEQKTTVELLLKLALYLTFGFYVFYGMTLYFGSLLSWHHYFENWGARVGFFFMTLLVLGMAVFLSKAKHFAYIYFGIFGSITLVLVTLIGFAIFAEIFTSSSNQNAKSEVVLKGNQAYQDTVSKPTTVTYSNTGLSLQIAKASKILARCEEKLKQGKEKHCEGDRASLKALQETEHKALQNQQDTSLEATKLNHERQDKLKADSYNPIIVSIAKILAFFLGGSYVAMIKTALSLAMLFGSVCFEILHHFLSVARGNIVAQITIIENKIAFSRREALQKIEQQKKAKQRLAQAKQAEQIALAKKNALKLKKQKEAQKKQPPSPVPKTVSATPEVVPLPSSALVSAEAKKPSIGFIQDSGKGSGSGVQQWQKGLKNNGVLSPVDPALSQEADKEKINRIVQAGLVSGQAVNSVPVQSENPIPEPFATVQPEVSKQSGKVSEECVHTLQNTLEQLYSEWVKQLRGGQIKPTVRPARELISKTLCQQVEDKTLTLTKINETVKDWMMRAEREGVLKFNKKQGRGVQKYLLA